MPVFKDSLGMIAPILITWSYKLHISITGARQQTSLQEQYESQENKTDIWLHKMIRADSEAAGPKASGLIMK